ncbi:hypothetical protein HDV03_004431 [Kappamyces sp. JEL0829]|nr:hypothetical protein HDV03_004431 [Kappamyces sp. JEL0829]KAJ3361759.1 hypothetical protein HDU91_003751 [Kappamyces sp. JEL0680]
MNLGSFQELPFWYNEVKRNAPDATVFLIGTKGDEPDAMVVKVQDILKITKEWNVEYKATSAKVGTNIDELFESIYSKISL